VSIKIPRAICTSAIRQLGGGALASPWTTGTGASVVIAPMVHAARVTHDACFPQARPAPVGRSLWSNGQPSADSDHSPRKDTLRGLIQKAVITRRAVPVPVYFSGKCCSYRRKELIESLLKHVALVSKESDNAHIVACSWGQREVCSLLGRRQDQIRGASKLVVP